MSTGYLRNFLLLFLFTIGGMATLSAQNLGNEGGYTLPEVEVCGCDICDEQIDCDDIDFHEWMHQKEKEEEEDKNKDLNNGDRETSGSDSDDIGSGGGGSGGNGNMSGGNNNDTEVKPFDFFKDKIGSLDFYVDIDTYLREIYGDEIDIPTYYIEYGDKYLQKFNDQEFLDKLSDKGKEWVDKATEYLQEEMIDILNSDPNICLDSERLEEAAFDSHVSAYLEAGFLDISAVDKMNIVLIVEPKDLLEGYGMEQVLRIGLCQILYWSVNTPALISDLADFVQNYGLVKDIAKTYVNYWNSRHSRSVLG